MLVAALACQAAAWAPPARHEVMSLPGVSGGLPTTMYTGYIDAGPSPSGIGGNMMFHYWCAMSARDVANDPVLLWYNGGPGASSLFGLLQEFGPLLLTLDSRDDAYRRTGVPTPLVNAWSWSARHTVCAIDSPPPMGLSYCADAGPAAGPTSCGPWTDATVFAANHAAHRAFFTRVFPELRSNPVYLVGESYAGIYVPGFAQAMLDDPVPGLNFRGFAVGDGFPGCRRISGRPVDWCIDLDNVGLFKYPNANPGPLWDVEFFHGHGQFSSQLYRDILGSCSYAELRGETMLGHVCAALVSEMAAQVGPFDPYNLLNACSADSLKHGANRARAARVLAASANSAITSLRRPVTPGDGDGGVGSSCLGDVMSEWLLLPQTLEAIGAPPNANFINLDNGHGFDYTIDRHFVGDVYEAPA